MPTGTKITVTLDPALLARIDAARAPGQTRSGFIAAALTASLDRSAAPRPVNPRPPLPAGVIGAGRGQRGRQG